MRNHFSWVEKQWSKVVFTDENKFKALNLIQSVPNQLLKEVINPYLFGVKKYALSLCICINIRNLIIFIFDYKMKLYYFSTLNK